jgi:hypothetical protein
MPPDAFLRSLFQTSGRRLRVPANRCLVIALAVFSALAGTRGAVAEPQNSPSSNDATSVSAAPSDAVPDLSILGGTILYYQAPDSTPAKIAVAEPQTQDASFATRKNNNDGTSLVTVGANLPVDVQTKVGVDLGLTLASSYQPTPCNDARSLQQAGSSGAAWANLTLPGSPLPGWDKTSLDARVDPQHDRSLLGTTLSRTISLANDTSVTLQNGYAMTQTIPTMAPMPQPFDPITLPAQHSAQTVANAAPAPIESWTNEDAVRFNLASTGTTFSVGTKMQSDDDRLLRSFSAEQKLFNGPVSITGTIAEQPNGDTNKSIMAGFKHSW